MKITLLLWLLYSLLSIVQAQPICAQLFFDKQELLKMAAQDIVSTNYAPGNKPFQTFRGLDTIVALLPNSFERTLDRMVEKHKILDAGAGESFFGEELLRDRIANGFSQPAVTAITYEMLRKPPTRYGDRLKVLLGRFFEEIPSEEIGKQDLIIDAYGIYSYTHDPILALSRYWELLNDGGKAYVFYGIKSFSTVITKSGERVELEEYLEKFGIRIEEKVRKNEGDEKPVIFQTMVLTKSNRNFSLPKLVLQNFTFGHPPVRVYQEE